MRHLLSSSLPAPVVSAALRPIDPERKENLLKAGAMSGEVQR